jgi:hypothetical protein
LRLITSCYNRIKHLNRKISTIVGKSIPNPSVLDRCKVEGVENIGMSWEEHSLWAVKPSLLVEIVNERKRNIDSGKLVLPNV